MEQEAGSSNGRAQSVVWAFWGGSGRLQPGPRAAGSLKGVDGMQGFPKNVPDWFCVIFIGAT